MKNGHAPPRRIGPGLCNTSNRSLWAGLKFFRCRAPPCPTLHRTVTTNRLCAIIGSTCSKRATHAGAGRSDPPSARPTIRETDNTRDRQYARPTIRETESENRERFTQVHWTLTAAVFAYMETKCIRLPFNYLVLIYSKPDPCGC